MSNSSTSKPNKTIKSIDEDIENTLEKLCILLQYSTFPASDEVHQLLIRAKAAWEGSSEEG